jgi:hypothetical protein
MKPDDDNEIISIAIIFIVVCIVVIGINVVIQKFM